VQLGADTLAIGAACDCRRMANQGHCGAAAANSLGQDIPANMY
jgi:hypothetical protein